MSIAGRKPKQKNITRILMYSLTAIKKCKLQNTNKAGEIFREFLFNDCKCLELWFSNLHMLPSIGEAC